ncbi:CIA30 family protein [Microscilla marina]|nr:CIA30 family protein [Microscilla marina]
MKYIITAIIMTLTSTTPSKVIFNFDKNVDIEAWRIVDDVVMGGNSSGVFKLSPDGFGVFEGAVSLENNGGFSSVRYQSGKVAVAGYTKVVIKLKGDGKKYQFRLKSNANDYYSYITTFTTSGEWQEVSVPLKDLAPSFRGRMLDMPHFSSEAFEELAFLIANKKAEKFRLLIDRILLK